MKEELRIRAEAAERRVKELEAELSKAITRFTRVNQLAETLQANIDEALGYLYEDSDDSAYNAAETLQGRG